VNNDHLIVLMISNYQCMVNANVDVEHCCRFIIVNIIVSQQ